MSIIWSPSGFPCCLGIARATPERARTERVMKDFMLEADGWIEWFRLYKDELSRGLELKSYRVLSSSNEGKR